MPIQSKKQIVGVEQEEHFRDYLAHIGLTGSVISYPSYLRSVAHGIREDITPKLIKKHTIEDVLKKAEKTPLRRKNTSPTQKTLQNWRSALNAYKDFCDKCLSR